MKTIHLLSSLVAVIGITVVIGGVEPPPPKVTAKTSHVEPISAPKKVEPTIAVPPAAKAAGAIPAPPAEPNCGPHSAREVYDILISIGVPKLAAIQQTGSWQHESGGDFNQCQQRGDSGTAWGLNSWHAGRRVDMPMGLVPQVKWAVFTEMPRDCQHCFDQFMAAGDVWSVRSAIQQSTRWGVEGNRWQYADTLTNQL